MADSFASGADETVRFSCISRLSRRTAVAGRPQLPTATSRDSRGMADHGYEIAMPACLGPQNAEAILSVVVGDALDETGQHFLG